MRNEPLAQQTSQPMAHNDAPQNINTQAPVQSQPTEELNTEICKELAVEGKPFDLSLLNGRNDEDCKELVGSYIFFRAEKLYGNDDAGKIAGLILGFELQQLRSIICNIELVDRNIKGAYEYSQNSES